jgi:Cof subfamily protein (haloacid dehalogenase superfamily)
VIKLVALDLDGTLLDPSSRVSEEDQAAVKAARDRGVLVVLNTARWYGIAQRTAKRLELAAPLICHNGAHVQMANDGEELLHVPVPEEPARAIAAFCDERGFETYTTVDGTTYMRTPFEAQIDPARLPAGMVLAKRHAEHVAGPATGLIVFSAEGVRGVVAEFEERYRGEVEFAQAWSETSQPYVSITGPGVDKGRALRLVCEHFGVALDEAMAVGDALPDVAMFEVAGVSVAMGNAPDDVKARAGAVAPSNAESGVAWALRRFVLDGA